MVDGCTRDGRLRAHTDTPRPEGGVRPFIPTAQNRPPAAPRRCAPDAGARWFGRLGGQSGQGAIPTTATCGRCTRCCSTAGSVGRCARPRRPPMGAPGTLVAVTAVGHPPSTVRPQTAQHRRTLHQPSQAMARHRHPLREDRHRLPRRTPPRRHLSPVGTLIQKKRPKDLLVTLQLGCSASSVARAPGGRTGGLRGMGVPPPRMGSVARWEDLYGKRCTRARCVPVSLCAP